MPKLTTDFRRKAARALEWFVVRYMADRVPPLDRFLLLYEVVSFRKPPEPRIERALKVTQKLKSRGGFAVGDFALANVDREQLAEVIDSPEWMRANIDTCESLGPNQARCVVIQENDAEPPEVIILAARTAHRAVGGSERRGD
jgi:hypothetical protein